MQSNNPVEWNKILNSIFVNQEPQNMEWTDLNAIINILNKIGAVKESNHMFLPSRGGMDLAGAKISTEKGCLELVTCGGNVSIVKPSKLSFNWFGQENLEWSYFRLETSPLAPSGVYKTNTYEQEEVTELTPGKYVDFNVWEANEYQGKPIPRTARQVRRVFTGDFAIFPKESIYNIDLSRIGLGDAYDARHNQMSPSDFRQYIQRIVNKLSEIRKNN